MSHDSMTFAVSRGVLLGVGAALLMLLVGVVWAVDLLDSEVLGKGIAIVFKQVAVLLNGTLLMVGILSGAISLWIASSIHTVSGKIGGPGRGKTRPSDSERSRTALPVDTAIDVLDSFGVLGATIGFLGTILGLCDVFNAQMSASAEAALSPHLLSAGMMTALVTSVFGLAIRAGCNLSVTVLDGWWRGVRLELELQGMPEADLEHAREEDR